MVINYICLYYSVIIQIDISYAALCRLHIRPHNKLAFHIGDLLPRQHR